MASETKTSTRAQLDALQVLGLDVAGAAGLGGVLAQFVAERLARHQGLARRGAERERLDARRRAGHRRLADDRDRRRRPPGSTPTLRAVDDSSSATSVSSIWSVAAISAKPKSIIQGLPVRRQQTLARRRSRWAMRCVRICLHALPDARQHVVGDGLVGHPVQGVAGGPCVGEQEALVAHVRGDHEARESGCPCRWRRAPRAPRARPCAAGTRTGRGRPRP